MSARAARIAAAALAAAMLCVPRAGAEAAAPALPALPPAVIEIHGQWGGQPFWARVLAANKDFGGNRVIQLSWQPPAPEALGGAHLVDCPFVLVDEHARIVAWDGRDSLAKVKPLAGGGYEVVRALVQGAGIDAQDVPQKRLIHSPRAWDCSLAPLLVALAWQAKTAASVPLVDLFGTHGGSGMQVSWNDGEVTIAGAACSAVADASGRLARLQDGDGHAILTVDGPSPGSR